MIDIGKALINEITIFETFIREISIVRVSPSLYQEEEDDQIRVFSVEKAPTL